MLTGMKRDPHLDRGRGHRGRASRPGAHGAGGGRPGGRGDAGGGGRTGRGARHVRHGQLAAGLHRRAGRGHPGRALGPNRRLPHGRVRRGRTGPPGRLRALDPRADRRAGPSQGGVLRRGPGRPGRGVPALRGPACGHTRWTCAVSGSGRTGISPSTTRRWPTSTIRSTSRWSSSTMACRAQQVNEGHFADLDAVPTRAITVTVPALLRAGQVLAIVPEARKAEPVLGRPLRVRGHQLSRHGAAHDRPRHDPPRSGLGPTSRRLTGPPPPDRLRPAGPTGDSH